MNIPKSINSALRIFAWVLIGVGLGSAWGVSAETLTGAGSSAAAPVYKAWAAVYARTQNFQLAYDPSGSSAGLKQIKAGEVDFGASDVAPSSHDLARDHLVLVPTFVTGAVPVVNLPKFSHGKLRLTGEILVDIFFGKITRWNAPAIQNLNVGLTLPDLAIKPVVRSDGSGTTFYFTDYLSKVSPEWKDKFGAKNTIAWPDNFVGAKGSAAVAKKVKETIGSIGYIDFNYVTEYGLNPIRLRNLGGEFVAPGVNAFRSALQASDWSSKGDFHASLANLPGSASWPIAMGTFILLPQMSSKPVETTRALRFFMWTLLKGDQVVEGLSFVRLPDKMQALAYKALSSVTDQKGKPLGHEAMAELSKE